MQTTAYLARQPILDSEGDIFAYELLYRNFDADTVESNSVSTAVVVFNLLNRFGMQEVIGTHQAFIKVDSTFLHQESVLSIPKEKFILSLFNDIDLRRSTLERIQYLHKEGYRFAINDSSLDHDIVERFEPIAGLLDFFKIDTTQATCDEAAAFLPWAAKHNIEPIVTKIEDKEVHQACAGKGLHYFQGYYFAQPELHSLENVNTVEKMTVMNIWRLIMSDSSLRDISKEFETSPVLEMQLIKYMNSAAFSFKAPIRSIEHVLSLLGRLPLMQWLLLLIHTKNFTSGSNTALQSLVINRINTMIGLNRLLKTPLEEREVHFVGLLSFIEVLLGIPLDKVLEDLKVENKIADALHHHSGVLGDLLQAARSIEKFDTEAIDAFLEKYAIEMDDIVELTLKTIEIVNHYEASYSHM